MRGRRQKRRVHATRVGHHHAAQSRAGDLRARAASTRLIEFRSQRRHGADYSGTRRLARTLRPRPMDAAPFTPLGSRFSPECRPSEACGLFPFNVSSRPRELNRASSSKRMRYTPVAVRNWRSSMNVQGFSKLAAVAALAVAVCLPAPCPGPGRHDSQAGRHTKAAACFGLLQSPIGTHAAAQLRRRQVRRRLLRPRHPG